MSAGIANPAEKTITDKAFSNINYRFKEINFISNMNNEQFYRYMPPGEELKNFILRNDFKHQYDVLPFKSYLIPLKFSGKENLERFWAWIYLPIKQNNK